LVYQQSFCYGVKALAFYKDKILTDELTLAQTSYQVGNLVGTKESINSFELLDLGENVIKYEIFLDFLHFFLDNFNLEVILSSVRAVIAK
jgi:hypothetical protein